MKRLIGPLMIFAVLVTVQNACLAATDAWPVLWGNTNNVSGPFQIMADGAGGCACRYNLKTNNADYTVILWVDSRGNQNLREQYRYIEDAGASILTNIFYLVSVDKQRLVYQQQQYDRGFCHIVIIEFKKNWLSPGSSTGYMPAADYSIPIFAGTPVATDKKNYFFLHSGDNANIWLERHSFIR